MSKRGKTRYRLSTVRSTYEEAMGIKDGMIEFEGAKGETYKIPHPAFLDSDQQAELDVLTTPEQIVAWFLGEEQYKTFVKNDNDHDDFGLLLNAIGAEFREKSERVKLPRF